MAYPLPSPIPPIHDFTMLDITTTHMSLSINIQIHMIPLWQTHNRVCNQTQETYWFSQCWDCLEFCPPSPSPHLTLPILSPPRPPALPSSTSLYTKPNVNFELADVHQYCPCLYGMHKISPSTFLSYVTVSCSTVFIHPSCHNAAPESWE